MAKTSSKSKELKLEQVETVDSGISLDDLMSDVSGDDIFIESGMEAEDDLELLEEPVPQEKSAPSVATEQLKIKPVSTRVSLDDPIEAKISDVGDIPKYMTIVVYGKNGTGKTTFGASGDRTLVLEVEKDGTFSVRDRGSKAKKFPIRTWKDFEDIYWYLKRNPDKFDIVCIDTLTRLNELCVRDVVLGDKASDAELMDNDVIRVSLQQRGDISQKMIFWLNAYANLPLHKVWICQEASGENESYDVYPDLQRKIRNYVCADATIIGRMIIRMKQQVVDGVVKEVPQYVLMVKPSEQYLSKDRTNVIGAGMVNPKIDKLISAVYAH
jgi:hypothetical protein